MKQIRSNTYLYEAFSFEDLQKAIEEIDKEHEYKWVIYPPLNDTYILYRLTHDIYNTTIPRDML